MTKGCLLILLPLAACAAPEPIVVAQPVAPRIPDELTVCPDEPPPPAGEFVMESAYARWVVELRGAGQACRETVQALRLLLQ